MLWAGVIVMVFGFFISLGKLVSRKSKQEIANPVASVDNADELPEIVA